MYLMFLYIFAILILCTHYLEHVLLIRFCKREQVAAFVAHTNILYAGNYILISHSVANVAKPFSLKPLGPVHGIPVIYNSKNFVRCLRGH